MGDGDVEDSEKARDISDRPTRARADPLLCSMSVREALFLSNLRGWRLGLETGSRDVVLGATLPRARAAPDDDRAARLRARPRRRRLGRRGRLEFFVLEPRPRSRRSFVVVVFVVVVARGEPRGSERLAREPSRAGGDHRGVARVRERHLPPPLPRLTRR